MPAGADISDSPNLPYIGVGSQFGECGNIDYTLYIRIVIQ